jgi:hypothetical protein
MSFRRIVCLCGCPALLAVWALGAQAPAQSSPPSSTSTSSSASSSKPVGKTGPSAGSPFDSGSVSNGVYRNNALGFSCKIPEGWVLRTEEMNVRDDEDKKANGGKTATDDAKAGRVLLAAFSRPPQARAEDVNSSILIAAEKVAAYPGLKEAAQYFGPLTEVAKLQGFAVVNEPYEFLAGAKTVVRGEFQKDVGTRVLRQSTLVILVRGYAVSFTFLGGTEDEVEELIQGLSFVTTRAK